MKRILFLIVCLMPFSVKADMDNKCLVEIKEWMSSYPAQAQALASGVMKCKRNNILFVSGVNLTDENALMFIANYCRFDRNVVRGNNSFTCVLYRPTQRL